MGRKTFKKLPKVKANAIKKDLIKLGKKFPNSSLKTAKGRKRAFKSYKKTMGYK